MLSIKIICVGKLKEKFWTDAAAEYAKRLSACCRLEIEELPEKDSVTRELILLKVRAKAEERQQIIAVADVFRAKIVDVAQNSLTVELTGNQAKLEAFIRLLENYEILEMARTGIIGLFRGERSLGQEKEEK